ncbi:MAG TPA: DUF4443 domain-containing protein [Nitrososphaerales archaeon]|nr:DUF4443 domain-containing protein [Nitrososphaerales archaeon]
MSTFAPLVELFTFKERGPAPSFSTPHLVLAFLVIGDRETLGRHALARRVGLGDGAVRTVLRKLKDAGYLKISASGCSLTKSGRQLYSRLRARLARTALVEHSPFTIGSKQAALLVKGGGTSVHIGIEQRDSAMRVGALGATTYVVKGARFAIPGGSSDCERDFPSPDWKKLRSELSPEEGDALILCGSDDNLKSELGAIAAALTLV